MRDPARGEVWYADLNPVRGREQAGHRRVLVVSSNLFNESPAELVIVLPITSKEKGIRSHVPMAPPEGGLKSRSYIKCEDVRSIAKERLTKRLGWAKAATMAEVESHLRYLMEL